MKKRAIICDIDGCLLNTDYIHQEIKEKGLEGAAKWRYFETYANDIDVNFNHNLGGLLESLARDGYEIILSTARNENIRHQTILKLRINLDCKFKLYMRASNDISPACEVKRKHLKQIQEEYAVEMAIDDEDANLKMFSSNGLFVMKAI